MAALPAATNNSRSILALNVEALSLFRIVFSIYLAANFFLYVYPWYDDFYGNTGVFLWRRLPVTMISTG